jgi:type I restriction enzyme, S subunit
MKAYSKYKDSGIVWVGNIPEHWSIRRLKYIVSITTGGSDTVDNVEEGKYPFFVRSQNVERINSYSYDGEAVLTAGDGVGVAKVFHYANGKFDFHQRVYKFSDFKDILGKFFFYYVRNNLKYEVLKLSAKSTVDSLRMPMLQNFFVALPSVDEQRTIVDFLDCKTAQIDALTEKKQRQIDLLQEQRTALINHAFTKGLNPDAPMKDSGVEWLGDIPNHWEVISLGKEIKLQRGVDITKNEQEDGNVPVVSSGGIASYHNKAIAKGPGVVVGRKGSVGKLHYLEQDYWPHDTTLYVENFKGNSPRFVYYKLLTMNLARFDTGSSNPTLNRNIIHPEKVSWTSFKEQVEIIDWLDKKTTKIDLLIESINREIDLLNEYRTALISEAVTGKINVTPALA